VNQTKATARKKDKTKDKYWHQPPPPAQQKEPDGTGLLMTETKALDNNGETLEQVSSNQDEKSPDKTRGATAEWDSDSDEREFDGVGQFYAGAGKDVTSSSEED